MQPLIVSIFFALLICAHGFPYRLNAKSEPARNRQERSLFPFVVGETILDIQCKRGYLTVCAPDGPDACPIGYSSQTNVGVCGFATLNHYLNTSNLAGTCCYKLADTSATTTTGASTSSNSTAQTILTPQIIAYPVYAQYPYAISSGSSSGTSGTSGTSGMTSGTSGMSSSYGSTYGR
ncbi:uncharacterized protein LOC129587209 [Paramacrobiotus metropolitanus]|uniref:uncharacterized protein LOC129587209 n=1 Tax=Paramacrobiotus metropolitanus TaxID=2943436 RepID=UPI0024462794|nr:uncharacterized protein LOC129587209 [Paramacrobiotus metropolitanus]